MDRIKVTICAGTTCHLMGGAFLQALSDHIAPEIMSIVDIEGARCLGLCKGTNYGDAPFVLLNGQLMSGATLPVLIERIESLAREEVQ